MKKLFYERPELTQFEESFNENLSLLNHILNDYHHLNISNINSMDGLKNLLSNPVQFVLEALKQKLPVMAGSVELNFDNNIVIPSAFNLVEEKINLFNGRGWRLKTYLPELLTINNDAVVKNEFYEDHINKNYRVFLTDEEVGVWNKSINFCDALNELNQVMDMKRLPLPLMFKYDIEGNLYSLRKEQFKK